MAKKTIQPEVDKNEEGKKPLNFHEREEERLTARRLYTLENNHLYKWANKNTGVSEGRVGKLLSKVKNGTLKPAAFKRAIELLKDPNKREDGDCKKMIDHLIKGEYNGFGDNFIEIADAFESDNEDINKKALAFVRQQEIQGERSFLKQITAIKKSQLSPETLVNQTKGALAVAGIDKTTGDRPHEEKAVDVVRQGDIGILPRPPEELVAEYPALTRKVTEYVQESTAKLDEISELVRKSGELAVAKTTLQAKMESDPNFVSDFLRTLLSDYELLKKSATLLSQFEGSPELLRAIKKTDAERNAYFRENPSRLISKEESPHSIFMEAEDSQGARETLLKTAQKNIGKLLNIAVELDIEREIDGVIFDAEKLKRAPTSQELQKAISKIRAKYSLAQDTAPDIDFLKDLEAKAQEYISHALENEDLSAKFLTSSLTARKWGNRCLDIIDDVERMESKSGIRLLDSVGKGKEELRIFERDPFTLSYKKSRKEAVVEGLKVVPQYEDDEDLSEKENIPTVEVQMEIGERKIPASGRWFDRLTEYDNAYEKIATVEDAEEEIKRLTGLEIKLQPGLQLLNEFESEKGEPRYGIIGIRDIVGGRVILQHPIAYKGEDDIRDSLNLGELCKLIKRRNLIPLDDGYLGTQSTAVDLPNKPTPYKLYDRRGGEETKWFAQSGSLGDVLEKYGPGIFVGAVTDDQINKFKNTRTFQESGYGPNGMHFVKENIPAARLATMQNKRDMEEDEDVSETEKPRKTAENKPDVKPDADQGNDTHEGDEPSVEMKPPQLGNPKVRGDYIPFEHTGSIVDMHRGERGYIGRLWQQSRFLSVDDLIGLGKAVYENYQRRWHRKSKERFASVGKGLPLGYGAEMSRIKQAAEDEEVHTNMEAMEHWGIDQIVEAMHEAQNADQLKACIEVLSKKGHIRWDDCRMWEAINKYVPDHLTIPIPANHNPYAKDKKTGKTGFSYLEAAIDSIWGQSTYQDWKEANNSNYNHKVQENFEHGKQMEGDPKGVGGVGQALKELLAKHKAGEYVDPHEYEGLLQFIIKWGKTDGPEYKLYYIVEGLTAENPNTGETIMSFERLSSINSEFCNIFPMLDYLTSKSIPDKTAPEGKRAWTLEDFKAWAKYWDAGAPMGGENMPNERVRDHMWHYALTDRKTLIRNNKGLKKAQDMDHDDAHVIIPLADSTTVERACQLLSGQQVISQEGYANAFSGYNQYMKILGQRRDTEKLTKTIQGWVRFEAIMDNRFQKGNNGYTRLGNALWDNGSVVDEWTPRRHKEQIYSVINAIAEAYADVNPRLREIVQTMQRKTRSTQDETEKKEQTKVQQALEDFDQELEDTVKSDGGAKMADIVSRASLRGIVALTPAEKKARKKAMEEAGFSGTDSDD